jgi:hypothetical protein
MNVPQQQNFPLPTQLIHRRLHGANAFQNGIVLGIGRVVFPHYLLLVTILQ